MPWFWDSTGGGLVHPRDVGVSQQSLSERPYECGDTAMSRPMPGSPVRALIDVSRCVANTRAATVSSAHSCRSALRAGNSADSALALSALSACGSRRTG
jgi:hypothetical protein